MSQFDAIFGNFGNAGLGHVHGEAAVYIDGDGAQTAFVAPTVIRDRQQGSDPGHSENPRIQLVIPKASVPTLDKGAGLVRIADLYGVTADRPIGDVIDSDGNGWFVELV